MFVRDGTVGRICKSAPTVFVNLVAQAVEFVKEQYFREGMPALPYRYRKFSGT